MSATFSGTDSIWESAECKVYVYDTGNLTKQPLYCSAGQWGTEVVVHKWLEQARSCSFGYEGIRQSVGSQGIPNLWTFVPICIDEDSLRFRVCWNDGSSSKME